MKRRALSIEGQSVSGFPSALYNKLKTQQASSLERYDGDGFGVIIVEEFYLRNLSDQTALIIFDRLESDRARVTILSGGGGAGLLRANLGSHQTQTDKIVKTITDICDSEGLQWAVDD